MWLKGGYNAWYNTFDNKMKRRVFGEYAETWRPGYDGDSCGIHASGAGFDKVRWAPCSVPGCLQQWFEAAC